MCIKYERKCTLCATEQGSSYLECDSHQQAYYVAIGDQHQAMDQVAGDQMQVNKPAGGAQQGRDQTTGTQQLPGVEECWRSKGEQIVNGDHPPGMCKRSDCLKLQDQVREWQRETAEDEAGGEHN